MDATEIEKLRKETRPCIDVPDVPSLLSQLFAFEGSPVVSRLNSYDDANFCVTGTLASDQQPQRYVLKIHNGTDSQEGYLPFVDAMNQVMLHLAAHGILTNRPIANRTGQLIALVQLPVHVCLIPRSLLIFHLI
jgi:Ser/Thr protein kinase RdoA (MazF antagonist)